jgi:hypothetical protein
MGRVIPPKEILDKQPFAKFCKIVDEVKQMASNGESDFLRIMLDELDTEINGNSKKYDDGAINRVGDIIVALPLDLGFSILKDFSTNVDLCERLILKRDDVFKVLKDARKVVYG